MTEVKQPTVADVQRDYDYATSSAAKGALSVLEDIEKEVDRAKSPSKERIADWVGRLEATMSISSAMSWKAVQGEATKTWEKVAQLSAKILGQLAELAGPRVRDRIAEDVVGMLRETNGSLVVLGADQLAIASGRTEAGGWFSVSVEDNEVHLRVSSKHYPKDEDKVKPPFMLIVNDEFHQLPEGEMSRVDTRTEPGAAPDYEPLMVWNLRVPLDAGINIMLAQANKITDRWDVK